MRPSLVVIRPFPRAAIDRHLRAAARIHKWRLVREVPRRGPVAIVNAQPPGFAVATIAMVFRLLAEQDVAIAPTDAGGYWLVGLAQRRRLKRMRWPAALDELLPLLLAPRLKVELLAMDDAAPLRLQMFL
jgi:hypothetical protein